MANDELFENKEFLQVVEASDRAGAIVREHVRSIVQTAEQDADRIRARAEEDALRIRREAADAAARVLGRLDALEGPLGQLVADLRSEADGLTFDSAPEA